MIHAHGKYLWMRASPPGLDVTWFEGFFFSFGNLLAVLLRSSETLHVSSPSRPPRSSALLKRARLCLQAGLGRAVGRERDRLERSRPRLTEPVQPIVPLSTVYLPPSHRLPVAWLRVGGDLVVIMTAVRIRPDLLSRLRPSGCLRSGQHCRESAKEKGNHLEGDCKGLKKGS